MILKQYGLNQRIEEKYPQKSGLKGRVIAKTEEGYQFITDSRIVKGTGRCALGDFVVLKEENGSYLVDSIVQTQSKLKLDGQLVTNVDTALIVVDPSQESDLSPIETYLNKVWDSGALPIIVIVNPSNGDTRQLLVKVRQIAAFVDVFVIDESTHGDQVLRFIRDEKTTLLLGSTNKNKEYLLKKLFNETITLTDQSLFVHQNKILMNICDLRLENAQQNVNTYQDIEDLIHECRFSDCTHTNEPGCKIIEALENGSLAVSHYESYLEMKAKDEEEVSVVSDEDTDDESYYINYRKKDKEKHKFTKKNGKDKEESFIY